MYVYQTECANAFVDEKLVLEHIVSYFSRFGSKNCAFEDIQSYVLFMRPDSGKAKAFIESLKQTLQPSDTQAIKNIYKNANIRKLERFLNLNPISDIKQSLAIVDELWKQYQDALPLGKDLKKTEMQYGDEFVILAAYLLLDLHHEYKQTCFLIQAISLLENALVKSIHNFQIKLILVRMYTMIGMFGLQAK